MITNANYELKDNEEHMSWNILSAAMCDGLYENKYKLLAMVKICFTCLCVL